MDAFNAYIKRIIKRKYVNPALAVWSSIGWTCSSERADSFLYFLNGRTRVFLGNLAKGTTL
jgi:hypothetical protein